MFEEKTFENIMQDMLSVAGNDVDTSEGSLMYEACAKIATVLENTYIQLSRLYDNLSIEDMEEEFFVTFAEDRSIYRIPATAPIVLCEVAQELDIGIRFSVDDYDYTITSLQQQQDDKYYYLAKCETTGTEANRNIGEMDPIDYVEDWKGGIVTRIVTYGMEQESLEDYKARFKELRYDIKSFAGNKAAYREYIQKYNALYGGTADCIPLRTSDKTHIQVWVVDAEYKALTQEVLLKVQEYVDPVSSSGEGDGTAPIGHEVQVKTPENVTINVSVSVTLDSDYSWDGVKDTIRTAIDKYLLAVRKLWSKNKKSIVRISQVEYAVLSVDGVLDCTSTKINGNEKNIELPYSQTPIMGSVTNG